MTAPRPSAIAALQLQRLAGKLALATLEPPRILTPRAEPAR